MLKGHSSSQFTKDTTHGNLIETSVRHVMNLLDSNDLQTNGRKPSETAKPNNRAVYRTLGGYISQLRVFVAVSCDLGDVFSVKNSELYRAYCAWARGIYCHP